MTENSASQIPDYVHVGDSKIEPRHVKLVMQGQNIKLKPNTEDLLKLLHAKQQMEEQIEVGKETIQQVTTYGYTEDYVITSLNKGELNYATTAYLLLHFGKR